VNKSNNFLLICAERVRGVYPMASAIFINLMKSSETGRGNLSVVAWLKGSHS